MTPITKVSEAKEPGQSFADIHRAVEELEADCLNARFDQWDTSKSQFRAGEVREYLQLDLVNVQVLKSTAEVEIPQNKWNMRINCADTKGSFWIEGFLTSAEGLRILIDYPIAKGLVNKHLKLTKVTIKGSQPQFDKTDFVLTSVSPMVGVGTPAAPEGKTLVDLVVKLADGKNDIQFRNAAALNPVIAGSESIRKGVSEGTIIRTLLDDRVLRLDEKGIYRKV